ncbi:MAG TPA: hypothetical protein VGH96_15270 [Streptosporangiaceae bacterium]
MKYSLVHYVDESTVTWFDDDVVADPQEDRDIEAWDSSLIRCAGRRARGATPHP